MSPLSTEKQAPGMLTDEDVREFQVLYEQEYGIQLTEKDAHARALRALTLVRVVYQTLYELEKETNGAYSVEQ
jgi:hypothetical protein